MSLTPSPSAYLYDIELPQVIKNVSSSLDELVDLFNSIGIIMGRLDIYTKIPPMSAMTETIIKIMAELLSTVALATKQAMQGQGRRFLTQREAEKSMKELFGEDVVEAVIQRLDRLSPDEACTTALQTLEVIHGLVQNMRATMDGETTLSYWSLFALEHRAS